MSTAEQKRMAREYLEQNTRPFRTSELEPCTKCGGPLRTDTLSFHFFTACTAVIDPMEARRAVGEEISMGPLARIMAPDRTIARIIPKTDRRVFLCETCLMDTSAYELIELAGDDSK